MRVKHHKFPRYQKIISATFHFQTISEKKGGGTKPFRPSHEIPGPYVINFLAYIKIPLRRTDFTPRVFFLGFLPYLMILRGEMEGEKCEIIAFIPIASTLNRIL